MAEPTYDPVGAARRGRFGIDTPSVAIAFGGLCIAALAFALAAFSRGDDRSAIGPLVAAAMFAASATVMVRGSLVGKPRLWHELVEGFELRGDEDALDVGCGRGLVTVMLARRLPDGVVTGVDIWRARDQSGNSRAAAEQNAAEAGVAERVSFVEADLTQPLPFETGAFDLVVTSLALRHLPTAGDRRAACGEMARVVRPGGRLVIVDVGRTGEFEEALVGAKLAEVERSGRRWATYPPFRVVTATKRTVGRGRRR